MSSVWISAKLFHLCLSDKDNWFVNVIKIMSVEIFEYSAISSKN